MNRFVLSALSLGSVASAFAGQIVPYHLDQFNVIQSISRDGRFALLEGRRIDAKTGRQPTIPFPPAQLFGRYITMSGNGQSIVGEFADSTFNTQGFVRKNGSFSTLEGMNGPYVTPYAASYDGRRIVGELWDENNFIRNVLWQDGAIALIDAGTFQLISGNGAVLLGRDLDGDLSYWEAGVKTVFEEPAWDQTTLNGTTFNGHSAIGYQFPDAVKWTRGVGFTALGHLPITGDVSSTPTAITDDGEIVTGQTMGGSGPVAFIKIGNEPIMRLDDFLTQKGIDTSEWSFKSATVSPNGEAIAGVGRYNGNDRAFHVWIKGQHLSVDLKVDAIRGGKTFQGTIAFAEPAPMGRRVTLTSGDPGVTVTPAVWVPAGDRTANFSGSVAQGTPSGDYPITAAHGGIQGSADVVVRSMIVGFNFVPAKSYAGLPITARITLSGPSKTPTVVNLQPLGSGLIIPNWFVTVPPNTTTYDFTVQTSDYGGYYSEGLEAYTFVSNGVGETRRAYVALYNAIHKFTVSPNPIQGGTVGTGRILAQLAAPAGGITYKLRSLTSLLAVPATASIPEAGTQVDFAVQAVPVAQNAVRTLEARIGGVARTCSVTITP